ncbi:MAG TPA: hypothetical protein VK604_03440 [Bryobacteraceae bacterium]|nr:hypothetical protein [Bryobacteraceae bacterium]
MFLPNLSGNGEVLSAGTEAALDFLLNDKQFLPELDRIRITGHRRPGP